MGWPAGAAVVTVLKWGAEPRMKGMTKIQWQAKSFVLKVDEV